MIARVTGGVLLTVAALACGACASLDEAIGRARAADDAALAIADREPPPPPQIAPPTGDDSWVVVAEGRLGHVPGRDAALATSGGALHRYVYRPGERGARRLRIAYVPAAPAVAGQGLADALGVRLRRSAGGGVLLTRDLRRAEAGDDASITMRVSAPDGRSGTDLRVILDPEFDGGLLLSPDVARALHLERFEIPGTVDVHVALGRPFFGRRARVRVAIAALDVIGDVEAVHVAAAR